MHLFPIPIIRRSSTRQPRQLFDLPDEILCLILEYCCQDLDYLLWACPLVTLDNQFCHDCFHCALCHGPIPRSQKSFQSYSTYSSNTLPLPSSSSSSSSTTSIPSTSTAQSQDNMSSSENNTTGPILRKRRKRCHERTACSTMNGSQRFRTCQQHHTRGSTPCPWNGNRPWCHHHQQQFSSRIPLLWRIFPQSMVRAGFSWTAPLASLFSDMRLSLQPCAKNALGRVVKHIKYAISYPSNQTVQRLDQPTNSQFSFNNHHQNNISSSSSSSQRQDVSSRTMLTKSSPIRQDSFYAAGRTTGYSSVNDNSQIRKRAVSLTEYVPGVLGTTMSRSFTSVGRNRVDPLREHDYPSKESESDLEMDESLDDFDSSVHLGLPFQLLLVSTWFADAAVQSLWRNLVFHGHDSYQLQSLLSMLIMNDDDDNDDNSTSNTLQHSNQNSDYPNSSLGFEKLKEINEEQENGLEFSKENNKGNYYQNGLQYRTKSPNAVEKENSGPAVNVTAYPPMNMSGSSEHNKHGPPLKPNECHETRSSWIESLNNSLKQFSRFQGVAGVYGSNTEMTPTGTNQQGAYLKTRSLTSSGHYLKYRNGYHQHSEGRPRQSRRRANEPMWSYRRHVRRVVLNFSHPQASPQMFVKVLGCLKTRCPDQISVLDLHANEKMRDAGLDRSEELERYFSSGFSKLRCLRLQGGFVDNQLLYAIIKGFGPLERKQEEYSSSSSSSLPPIPSTIPKSFTPLSNPPCRLTQVFLGPGSITDSAIEKLVEAAGHCLEVFAVTSCVDVGGGAFANLLTSCHKLRVLCVHRSIARDKELLNGLGIEQENHNTVIPFPQMNDSLLFGNSINSGPSGSQTASSSSSSPSEHQRKLIIAPLERLELGTVKLTSVGVSEILKGTCDTLRFLVLETQHFSEELLSDVITPFCTKLEGLYFDDPEYLQRQQQQMQGLGFSAGRRGAHLPKRQFEFGRSKRYFYSDPTNVQQDSQQSTNLRQNKHPATDGPEKPGSPRNQPAPNVSAWLGDTSVDDWVLYGDCALWTCATSSAVSYDNGGVDTGSQRLRNQHPRRQPLPLFNAYHGATYMTTMSQSSSFPGTSNGNGFYQTTNNQFLGDYDDILARYQVSRITIENTLQTLRSLGAFTVMEMDFLKERQGLSELKMMMQQDEMWVQSAGFRVLQLFYVFLFLGSIYFGTLRW